MACDHRQLCGLPKAASRRRGAAAARPTAAHQVLDLERKLCCTGCGNRQRNTLTVSMAPRN
jgi:hypothetical protein